MSDEPWDDLDEAIDREREKRSCEHVPDDAGELPRLARERATFDVMSIFMRLPSRPLHWGERPLAEVARPSARVRSRGSPSDRSTTGRFHLCSSEDDQTRTSSSIV